MVKFIFIIIFVFFISLIVIYVIVNVVYWVGLMLFLSCLRESLILENMEDD